ncbi:glutamine--tRNA ligase [Tanacetum coccineum]
MEEAAIDLFRKIGLDKRIAEETIGNNKVTTNLVAVINEADVTNGCHRSTGNLLYKVATKFPANALVHRPMLLQYILSSKIKTPAQLDAALAFLSHTGSGNLLDINKFEQACGVGIYLSRQDIKPTVDKLFKDKESAIIEQRYKTNVGDLFAHVLKKHPWADTKIVKELIDSNLNALLGEKTPADNEKPLKKKKEKPAAKVEHKGTTKEALPSVENPYPIFSAPKVPTKLSFIGRPVLRACNSKARFPPEPNGFLHIGHAKELIDSNLNAPLGEKTPADNEMKETPAKVERKGTTKEEAPEAVPSVQDNPFSIFPAPEENYKVHTEVCFSGFTGRPVLRACNSKAILEKHLKTTGGKVRTRFPPEPNGFLHIGHAKAMFVNFGLAKDRGGGCYLRFDDTNPQAEKKEYTEHIEEIVSWMGWKPFKITYTSDYFQKLYDLAVELICRGYAYVDHQTGDEIKEYREKKMNSPWRDRPISESLKLFNDMKEGMIDEGKATLRMKQDMQNDNGNITSTDAPFCMDPQFTPHPHAGDKWCIYPSYDYAHCIVDSLENITHSLCTLEFETRRASYYWLLDALSLYQPYVWEYSRLNITNTVMSKRKLNRLVTENYVDGWDDPRLMTLAGLKRRGVTSTAINTFVRGIGISRSDGSMIRLKHLEHIVRDELNKTAPRTMVVLHPLKVVITNLEASSVKFLDAKHWPGAPNDDASSYKVPFTNVVYIEQDDFRLKDSKGYHGLAPGKDALLRYAFPIKCTKVVHSEDKTTVVEIHAEYDPDKKTKPKASQSQTDIGVLHWVAEPVPGVDPLKVEVRLFNKLFNSENPGELDNWLDDLNPESKVVIPCAYGVPSLEFAEVGDKFQFERHGYFVVDKDSTPEKLIFNRTVALRDTNKPGSK